MIDVLKLFGPTLVVAVLLPAFGALLDVRARRVAREQLMGDDGKPKFATAADVNGLGGKVHKIQSEVTEARQVAEDAERGVRSLGQAQEAATIRLTEVVVEPMREIAATLKGIHEQVAHHGRELARQAEALNGLGRSVDDLRDRVRDRA